MQIIDLFSGVGGFSIAGHQLGWETILFCEKEPFPQMVLRERFPGVPIFDDVCKLTGEKINGLIQSDRPIILTGGFPCQPFSVAGAREGTEDDRHLWPEMFRIIQAVRPDYIIGENVPGLLSIEGGVVFEQVCLDLESEGYEVQAFVLPACATGAPHRRDRVWIVAYTNISRNAKQSKEKGIKEGVQREYREKRCSWLPYGTTGNDGTTSDTNEIGINRCSPTSSNEGEQPTNSDQSGGRWTGEIGGYVGEWTTSDTNKVRLQQCKNRAEMGGGQTEVCGTRGESSNAIETNGYIRTTSDTEQKRCGGWCDTNSITEEWEVHQDFGHNRNGIRSEIEGCGEFVESGINGNSEHNGFSTEQELRINETSSDQWGQEEQNASKQSSGTDRPIDATGIHGSENGSEQCTSENPGSSGCNDGEYEQQGSIGNFREPGTGGNEWDVVNANGGNYWHDWPSISPFHSGHDGLSTELVRHIRTSLAEAGETPENIEAYIRKESNYIRKEAIKCAGNAVVPTVVLQIMKAIQYHYENTND